MQVSDSPHVQIISTPSQMGETGSAGAPLRISVLCCSRHSDRCAKNLAVAENGAPRTVGRGLSLGTTAHAFRGERAFLICACCRPGPGSSLAVGSFPWQGVTFVLDGAVESRVASSESGWFLHGQMTVPPLTPLLTSVPVTVSMGCT